MSRRCALSAFIVAVVVAALMTCAGRTAAPALADGGGGGGGGCRIPTGVLGGIEVETVQGGPTDGKQVAAMTAALFNTGCLSLDSGLNQLTPMPASPLSFAVETEHGEWYQLCTAYTNSDGVAACSGSVPNSAFNELIGVASHIAAWSVVYSDNPLYMGSHDYGVVPGMATPPTPGTAGPDQLTATPNYDPGCAAQDPNQQATLGDLLTGGGNCQLVKLEGIITSVVFSVVLSVIGGELIGGELAGLQVVEGAVKAAQEVAPALLLAAKDPLEIGGVAVATSKAIAAGILAGTFSAASAAVGSLVGVGTAFANQSITIGTGQSLNIGSGTTLTNNSVIYNEGVLSDASGSGNGSGSLINNGVILNDGTIPGAGSSGLVISGNNFTLDFDSAGGSSADPIQLLAPTVAAAEQSLPSPTPPAGQVFAGWYTDGGTPVSNGTALQSVLGSGPVTATLHARYVSKSVTVYATSGQSGGLTCTVQQPSCPSISSALALIDANQATYAGRDVTIKSFGTFDETDTISAGELSSLTVLGEGDNDTVIDAGGSGTTLTVASGNVTFANLTITGGRSDSGLGGGVVVNSGATATLRDDSLSNNSSAGGGGAYNNGASLDIENSTVSGNSAGSGGGVLASGGSTTTLVNDTLTGNSAADPSSGRGGALLVTGTGNAVLTNDTIAWNTATIGGAGVAVTGADATAHATVTLANSILDSSGCMTSNSGAIVDAGYNVESDNSCGLGSNSVVSSSSIDLATSLPSSPSAAPGYLRLSAASAAALEVPLIGAEASGTLGCSVGSDANDSPRPELGQSMCDAGAVNVGTYPTSAPIIGDVSAGDGQATVSFGRPARTGGAAPSSYTVTALDVTTPANGGQSCVPGGIDTWCTVTGLTNGDTYTFSVTANNASYSDIDGTYVQGGGVSAPSLSSSPVVPAATPGLPTEVQAQSGDGQADVSWTAPSDDGGAPVLYYVVTSSDTTIAGNGGQSCIAMPPANDTCTVTGLTNGDSYTFTVTAANIGATSDSSSPSDPAVPIVAATVPGVPTGVNATSGDRESVVSWTAPGDDGGSAITGFTVTATDVTTAGNGGQTCTSSATTCTVTGLTNGDSYTFAVTATNGVGTGNFSDPSSPAVPATVPGVPSGVIGTSGDRESVVSWTAPTDDGGSAITGFTVTATDVTTAGNGGQTCTSSATTCTVTGLTNGDSYTFAVTATNGVGTGGSSDPSSPAVPATVPGVPSGVIGTSGDRESVVSWTAPTDDGGSAITGFTVTATDVTTAGNGGQTCTSSANPTPSPATTCTVTGLTNGDSYTFAVTATNGVGTGDSSGPSSPVVPGVRPIVSAVSPRTGLTTATTNIAVTGTGFISGATVVLSPGTAAGTGSLTCANVTLVSATRITCTAPRHAQAGAWNVLVRTTGGTSQAVTADHFTYVDPPRPTVTAVSPRTGLTTATTRIAVTGTGFSAGATVVLSPGGTAGTGSLTCANVTLVSATRITCTAPRHTQAGMRNVLVDTAGGTSTATAADRFSYVRPRSGH